MTRLRTLIALGLTYALLGILMNSVGVVILQSIRHLESYGLIETIRSGQYFVRKYFTEENDLKYGQDYDHFF